MNISTFNAFKSRNFRLYFSGQSVSLIGTWMQRTAVTWVIYSITHSAFMLGFTAFAGLFPSFLLSLVGGVVSDRYDRHKVLLITQILSLAQALILAILVLLNHYSVWEFISLSVLLGIINAFDVPARQSLVYEMVDDKELLPNAIALNSSMVTLSRILGPALAGIVLVKLGDGFCFGLNALSFVAVIASLLLMQLPKKAAKATSKHPFKELQEGFDYLKATPQITFILFMLAAVSLFVLPFNNLMAVYAKDVFKGNAYHFGIIDGFIGLGSFVAAIFLASLKRGDNLKKILAINTGILGIGLILMSHQMNYNLFLAFAVIAGFGMMSQMTISNTLIQTMVAPAMRGRIISFYAMAFFGMMPIGGLINGTASQIFGVENTILAEGCVAVLLSIAHFWFLKKNAAKKMAAVELPNAETVA